MNDGLLDLWTGRLMASDGEGLGAMPKTNAREACVPWNPLIQ
jgi:hypothetical protein